MFYHMSHIIYHVSYIIYISYMCVYTFRRIKSCLTDRRFPNLQGYMGTEGLRGCMGTLGYLAPEVVTAGLSNENAYTDKCDIWSLGVTR